MTLFRKPSQRASVLFARQEDVAAPHVIFLPDARPVEPRVALRQKIDELYMVFHTSTHVLQDLSGSARTVAASSASASAQLLHARALLEGLRERLEILRQCVESGDHSQAARAQRLLGEPIHLTKPRNPITGLIFSEENVSPTRDMRPEEIPAELDRIFAAIDSAVAPQNDKRGNHLR